MMQTVNPRKLFRQTTARLKNYLIQEIPEDLSPCEFDCHQDYCTNRKADTCEKRSVLLESYYLKPYS